MDEMLNTLVGRIVQSINPDKIILFGSRSRGQEGPKVILQGQSLADKRKMVVTAAEFLRIIESER